MTISHGLTALISSHLLVGSQTRSCPEQSFFCYFNYLHTTLLDKEIMECELSSVIPFRYSLNFFIDLSINSSNACL